MDERLVDRRFIAGGGDLCHSRINPTRHKLVLHEQAILNPDAPTAVEPGTVASVPFEHGDHTGGNKAMIAATGAKLLAHANARDKIPGIDRGLDAGLLGTALGRTADMEGAHG